MDNPTDKTFIQFAHLSDLHYVEPGRDTPLPTDTAQHLQLALRILATLENLAFVLVSGDLVDGGKREDYLELKRELERLRMPVLLALGNHDDTASFAKVFTSTPTGDHAAVIGGLHVLTLDSHIPKRVYGELRQEQLAWLGDELARHAALPKIVQIHHPPIFGKPSAAADEWHHLSASSSEALRRALDGYQVLGLFSGHVHTDQFTLWQGIPCFSTAGLNNTTDATYQDGLRAVRAASFNLCTVYGGDLRVTAVPLLALEDELFTLTSAQLQQFDPPAGVPAQKENP